MKRAIIAIGLWATVIGVTACGQKGPLKPAPGGATAPATQSATPSDSIRR